MQRTTHILNAATNLLGISLVIIAGLNVSKVARSNFADEVAWFAAVMLGASCLLSYLALRREEASMQHHPFELWADRVFLVGLVALFGSIVILASTQS